MGKQVSPELVDELSPYLAEWISAAQEKAVGAAVKPREFQKLEERAVGILKNAQATGVLEVLRRGREPVAVFLLLKPKVSRIKGERVLFFDYNLRHRKYAIAWVKRRLTHLGGDIPRYAKIGAAEKDAADLAGDLYRLGFHVRYDVLFGDTKVALKRLLEKKNPPKSLEHLGLVLRTLKTKGDVRQALLVQRRVFLKVPQHGNFSHTATQLRQDKKEYEEVVGTGRGRILGVYKDERMLGFMAAFIHETPGFSFRTGGFTLCLDPKIQGLGVAKTGYRLLLEYFKTEKVKRFYGGTSQPAVKGLAAIMGRKVELVLFVKADWKSSQGPSC